MGVASGSTLSRPAAPAWDGGKRAAKAAVLCFALALLVFTSAPPARADEKGQEPEGPVKFKTNIILLPIIYYTPETKLAFGAGGVVNFRLGRNKEETRPSSFWILGVYTLNKQFQLQLRPEIYLPKNEGIVYLGLRYERFPQKFFGVGSNPAEPAGEFYTPQTLGLRIVLKKKVLGAFYAGFQYAVDKTIIEDVLAGGLLAPGDIPGSRGGIGSGFGFNLNWDNRDNVLFPRRGQYFSMAADVYGELFGSDFNYTSLSLDLRSYFPFFQGHVLAFQAFFLSRGGTPPFYELAMLGGDSVMRGYYRGKYRDKTLVTVQTEYRMPVWWRFGIAAFAGLGEVCPGLSHFSFGEVKYSYGAGLRFKLDKREGTNVRVDFAWGKDSHGFYLTVQEAF